MKYKTKKYSIIEYIENNNKKYGFFYKREKEVIIVIPFEGINSEKTQKKQVKIEDTNYE